MKKKVLITTVLSASLVCAVAAVTFAACGEEKTYSVTYVKSTLNETGSVPTDTTKYAEGKEVVVKGKGDLALTDYTFSGWDYDGKTYTEGQKITMPAKDITLTAKWVADEKFTVNYDANGGTWEDTAPTTTKVASGTKITLPETTAVKNGTIDFFGWTDGVYVLKGGDEYTVSKDVTITALWSKLTTVVKTGTFNSAEATEDSMGYRSFTESFAVTAGKTYTVKIKQVSTTATGDQAAPSLEMYEDEDSWEPLIDGEGSTTFTIPAEAPITTMSAYFSWANWDSEISSVYSVTVYEGADHVTHTVTYAPLTEDEDIVYTVLDGVKLDKLLAAPTAPEGYEKAVFEGWYVAERGDNHSEPTYKPFTLDTVIDSDVLIVAQWTLAVYESEVTNDFVVADLGEKVGGKYTITLGGADTLTRDKYTLTGWKVDGDDYAFGDTLEIPECTSVFIEPVWEPITPATLSYMASSFDRTPVAEFVYAAGETVTVKSNWDLDLQAEDGYYFKGWYHVVDADNDETVDYAAGDSFTVPEGGAKLIADFGLANVTVYYYTSKAACDDDFFFENPKLTREYDLVYGEVTLPTAEDIDYDGDLELVGWYLNEDIELTTDYDFEEAEVAEVAAYPVFGKNVADYTSNGWDQGLANGSLNISYGQTATVKGTMIPGNTRAYDGIFVSIGNTAKTKYIMRRYDECALSAGDNAWNANYNTELGVNLSFTTSVVEKVTREPVTFNADWVATLMGGVISNYKVVVDYTSATQITVTTTFTSKVTTAGDDGDVTVAYEYIGVATLTARDLHVGLAQTYSINISGETNSRLEGGRIALDGEAGDFQAPPANHDWTEDSGYICSICHELDPAHPHNYVDEVCTLCGAIDAEHHTIHRYGVNGGFCTVCGNTYKAGDKVATLTSTALANNDPDGNWWNGITDRVEINEGDWVAYIKWEKVTSDPDYYDYAAEIITEAAKTENKVNWETNDRFRIDPEYNGSASGVFVGKYGAVAGEGAKDPECGTDIVNAGNMPANGTSGASLGQYTALFVRVGNTITFSVTCERDGAFFWSRTVTIDATDITGKLYLQIAGNPVFLENLTCASAALVAVNAD